VRGVAKFSRTETRPRASFTRLFPLPKNLTAGRAWLGLFIPFATIVARAATTESADPAFVAFQHEIQPVLKQYCYDCHGDGEHKGGVAFDKIADAAAAHDPKLWPRVLKNVRTGIMPPAEAVAVPPDEAAKLMAWIKQSALQLDPHDPAPGRVTIRRLNRVEYRNTIRDLLGVDYDTDNEFPADDTGHGFDNIGEVLNISPMLLEKYLDAAQAIVARAVPTQQRVPAEVVVPGREFQIVRADALEPKKDAGDESSELARPKPAVKGAALQLSYYTPAVVTATHSVTTAGNYELVFDVHAFERYVDNVFDLNRCRFIVRDGDEVLIDREFSREGESQGFKFRFPRSWQVGQHTLSIEIVPTTANQPQPRKLGLRLAGMTVRGPLDPKHWVKPPGYARIFPHEPPTDRAERARYAHQILTKFCTHAFRRPPQPEAVDGLVALAESLYTQPETTFESGIAQAMSAALASPHFLFREEQAEPLKPNERYPEIDEYALASRLSYFFWSSMPDEELLELAAQHRLRANLDAQVARLFASPKANEFVRNFTGQWLQARDIMTVPINSLDVYLRDHPDSAFDEARDTFRSLMSKPHEQLTEEEKTRMKNARAAFTAVTKKLKRQLNDELRHAMREETEMTFQYIFREDRSILELIESDYTFLNEDLARHYGIAGVTGKEMRKVRLPPGSPRGGVLTEGTVLTVTSNPTRTSAVKRGVFILNTILGTPPPPPPPNLPALEDAASPAELRKLTMRETIALHAKQKMCASCHLRMDPLGLALENFNAMGAWRLEDSGNPIDPSGELVTGETFKDIRELKYVLVTDHRQDFYYAFAEKMLTYALGRGLDYPDTTTLDNVVSALEQSGGKPSALLHAIVTSAPFQKCEPKTVDTTATSVAAR